MMKYLLAIAIVLSSLVTHAQSTTYHLAEASQDGMEDMDKLFFAYRIDKCMEDDSIMVGILSFTKGKVKKDWSVITIKEKEWNDMNKVLQGIKDAYVWKLYQKADQYIKFYKDQPGSDDYRFWSDFKSAIPEVTFVVKKTKPEVTKTPPAKVSYNLQGKWMYNRQQHYMEGFTVVVNDKLEAVVVSAPKTSAWSFQEGDIFWKEAKAINKKQYTIEKLAKQDDGKIFYNTRTITFYGSDTLQIDNSAFRWIRIK